ncbi:MAG: hypothetical protein PHI12_12040 [Dehalococcoidales bacterium]|nr:hypothetical protein [Dehalococcoidales bacterium]
MPKEKTVEKPKLNWAVPEELKLPPDELRMRLDFYGQAIQMTNYEGEIKETKMVSAYDIAMTLTSEMRINTGLLPENTLWWRNTRRGPAVALYEAPRTRKVALQDDPMKPAKRFNIPLPGLIFICIPATAPWVYAVKHRPTKEQDEVFKSPLLNVYSDGRTCPGTNNYPIRIQDIIESFFQSFFTVAADVKGRSNKYPGNILDMWKELDGKKNYPVSDLVNHGVIRDLLMQEM